MLSSNVLDVIENQLEVICHELVCLGVNVVQLVGEALDDLRGLVSNPSNSGYVVSCSD